MQRGRQHQLGVRPAFAREVRRLQPMGQFVDRFAAVAAQCGLVEDRSKQLRVEVDHYSSSANTRSIRLHYPRLKIA